MKFFALFTSLALALSLWAVPAEAASDLPESHRFHEEMIYLMNRGVISGFPDGSLKPDQEVTRAEAAIMIGRLKNLSSHWTHQVFSDVKKGQTASGYIGAAQDKGYITGYPDGTFRPYEPISRGSMAIIISRMFAFPFNNYADSFKDVSINMKAYEPIKRIVAGNVTTGYPDGTFRPEKPITRSEFSAFLARSLEPKFKNDVRMENSYMKDKTKTYIYQRGNSRETHRFVDVPNDWEERGFLWKVESDASSPRQYGEFEAFNRFFQNSVVDDGYKAYLVFPIKVGDVVPGMQTITGVNQTVETPYKTFTNAVEVTDSFNNRKSYVVEGFSCVKIIDKNGNAIFELIDVQ